MKIESPRFGTLEVDPSSIIEFPRGLLGFEDCKRYTLLEPQSEEAKYFILQSIDDPALAFHVADPSLFGFTYEISLSDEETAEIGLKDPSEAAVAVILSKPHETSRISANLQAPLIINHASRRGLQHVFARLDYAVTLKAGS
ncbi:MAG TPA: flagellar assembly protein FliW [Rhodocyclaceae bacterium]